MLLEPNHGWDSQELAVDEQRQSEVSTTALDKKHQCLGFTAQQESGCSRLLEYAMCSCVQCLSWPPMMAQTILLDVRLILELVSIATDLL